MGLEFGLGFRVGALGLVVTGLFVWDSVSGLGVGVTAGNRLLQFMIG